MKIKSGQLMRAQYDCVILQSIHCFFTLGNIREKNKMKTKLYMQGTPSVFLFSYPDQFNAE